MNITRAPYGVHVQSSVCIERGRRFVQSLRELASRSVWPQMAIVPSLQEHDHLQVWQLYVASLDL